ncbi:MAG TPA: sigma-70 family RNA polymerase sigma factor [Candidatus Sulfotelmatobacter sp.]|nr:sigma-70 family RNA polymerase sigma factor [Candidatus Sulfotelmatobacter sp.]
MAFRSQVDDFASLYERTYPAVFRTALGICGDPGLAADVTQDAYESAYRERARFRGQVPAEAWLHRIAVNAALSGLRRRRVRWAQPLDPDRDDRPATPSDPTDRVALADALGHLEPRARAAIVLRYYHDFDYATIASILETSAGNVGVLLSRALDRLRIDLEAPASRPVRPLSPTTPEADHGR